MGYKYIRTLGDAHRYGLPLDIICPACRREVQVTADRLLARFHAGVPLATLGDRMVCRGEAIEGGGCGHRGAIVRASLPGDPPPSPSTRPAPANGRVVPLRRASG